MFYHIFKTTRNFYDFSKLVSPVYPQPSLLGSLMLLRLYFCTGSLMAAGMGGGITNFCPFKYLAGLSIFYVSAFWFIRKSPKTIMNQKMLIEFRFRVFLFIFEKTVKLRVIALSCRQPDFLMYATFPRILPLKIGKISPFS